MCGARLHGGATQVDRRPCPARSGTKSRTDRVAVSYRRRVTRTRLRGVHAGKGTEAPMPGTHHYATELTWTGNTGSGTATYRSVQADLRSGAEGQAVAGRLVRPTFPRRRRPVEPGGAAGRRAVQCHLLSFLHAAADSGVVVVDYSDAATGTLRTEGTGGRMTGVVLRPVVTVAEPEMAAKCAELHDRAHARLLHLRLGELPGHATSRPSG